jgi:repressor LexA
MGAVITTIEKGRQKRKEILEAIISYIQEHGYAPTVREIGEMVGLKSASSVQSHLDRMLADGMIETDTWVGSPRAIRVPGYEFRKRTQEIVTTENF